MKSTMKSRQTSSPQYLSLQLFVLPEPPLLLMMTVYTLYPAIRQPLRFRLFSRIFHMPSTKNMTKSNMKWVPSSVDPHIAFRFPYAFGLIRFRQWQGYSRGRHVSGFGVGPGRPCPEVQAVYLVHFCRQNMRIILNVYFWKFMHYRQNCYNQISLNCTQHWLIIFVDFHNLFLWTHYICSLVSKFPRSEQNQCVLYCICTEDWAGQLQNNRKVSDLFSVNGSWYSKLAALFPRCK